MCLAKTSRICPAQTPQKQLQLFFLYSILFDREPNIAKPAAASFCAGFATAVSEEVAKTQM